MNANYKSMSQTRKTTIILKKKSYFSKSFFDHFFILQLLTV